MLTVVIPTLNDEERLALTLSALIPAAAEGVVREVVIVDGGSTDGTRRVADATGCVLVEASGPVGTLLRRGGEAAHRGEWLLFLRPGAVLENRWEAEVATFVERAARSGRADTVAAVFRFSLDEVGFGARVREAAVRGLSSVTRIPHPGQGLLISRTFYRRLGGYGALPALEDVDLLRRIGRFRLARLRSAAAQYSPSEGPPPAVSSFRRLRRAVSLALAALAVPPRYLVRLHG
ncbi:glycosyltransferase [Chthonobacter rhizosphaerae]|uniref:glycosyltransferase n=1 Tax=Chthonobacter rhizosphaerae TaxID=2735553 RepID=UPI0015EFB49F|nr:glycosyltransferase [Chthonobacter rhizosphaerae]